MEWASSWTCQAQSTDLFTFVCRSLSLKYVAERSCSTRTRAPRSPQTILRTAGIVCSPDTRSDSFNFDVSTAAATTAVSALFSSPLASSASFVRKTFSSHDPHPAGQRSGDHQRGRSEQLGRHVRHRGREQTGRRDSAPSQSDPSASGGTQRRERSGRPAPLSRRALDQDDPVLFSRKIQFFLLLLRFIHFSSDSCPFGIRAYCWRTPGVNSLSSPWPSGASISTTVRRLH